MSQGAETVWTHPGARLPSHGERIELRRVGDGTGGRSMVLLSHRRDGTTVLLARWTA